MFIEKFDISSLEGVGPAFYNCINKLSCCVDLKAIDDLANDLLEGLWEQFNIGPWHEISIVLRNAFSFASLVRARAVLLSTKSKKKVVEILDRGLVLGAPLGDNLQPNWLARSAERTHGHWLLPDDLVAFVQQLDNGHHDLELLASVAAGAPDVEQIKLPSVSQFMRLLQNKQPSKLLGLMECWPAMQKWNVSHFLQMFGQRTVPVEVGSRYTDEEWSQKMVTFEVFVRKFLCPENVEETGYLAQYNLLEQVPKLKEDIIIPDYCFVLSDSEPDVNLWIGGRTTSPLHFDDRENILTQV